MSVGLLCRSAVPGCHDPVASDRWSAAGLGVSSFGFSGCNALILEDAPPPGHHAGRAGTPGALLVLSARDVLRSRNWRAVAFGAVRRHGCCGHVPLPAPGRSRTPNASRWSAPASRISVRAWCVCRQHRKRGNRARSARWRGASTGGVPVHRSGRQYAGMGSALTERRPRSGA